MYDTFVEEKFTPVPLAPNSQILHFKDEFFLLKTDCSRPHRCMHMCYKVDTKCGHTKSSGRVRLSHKMWASAMSGILSSAGILLTSATVKTSEFKFGISLQLGIRSSMQKQLLG